MPDAPAQRLVAPEPVAGPSTPWRPTNKTTATPTHAYRTPPTARIQTLALFSDDEGDVEDDMAVVDAQDEVDEDEDEDDALPLSRRFRPVPRSSAVGTTCAAAGS